MRSRGGTPGGRLTCDDGLGIVTLLCVRVTLWNPKADADTTGSPNNWVGNARQCNIIFWDAL
jgi:hypothetical protein